MVKLTHYWYQKKLNFGLIPLLPFAKLFSACVSLRRFLYHKKFLSTMTLPVPVIVVGNITVGGTGKTPMVIWLAEFLKKQGYSPGIITRGVGGKRHLQAHQVQTNDPATFVGDEALLLHKNTNCPVVVCVNRVSAAQKLLMENVIDIIISDDGLQHYRLDRQIEIVMVDSTRRFGNQQLLPAGPLREPLHRLQTATFIVENGANAQSEYRMQLLPDQFVSISDANSTVQLSRFNRHVHAVAAIGNPTQFFNTLTKLGFTIIPHEFRDHYHYKVNDLRFNDHLPIVMTEKDAMKCMHFMNTNYWYLKVKPLLSEPFIQAFLNQLNKIVENKDAIKFKEAFNSNHIAAP